MKTPIYVSIAACLLLLGCGEKSDKPAQLTKHGTSATNLDEAPAGYLGALGKGQQAAVKTVDTASLNQAVQLFNVEHGRYPKDLDELVQDKYVRQLPATPHGMRLDYDAAAGKVRVVKQQ
jgi:hypothetical protein